MGTMAEEKKRTDLMFVSMDLNFATTDIMFAVSDLREKLAKLDSEYYADGNEVRGLIDKIWESCKRLTEGIEKYDSIAIKNN